MTSEAIIRRNRANARKSTGPSTAEGKTASAGNARRHGATARPASDDIAAWLAIILDRPDLGLADLAFPDDLTFRALALAEAEVKHAAAERALFEWENDSCDYSETTAAEPPPVEVETALEPFPETAPEDMREFFLQLFDNLQELIEVHSQARKSKGGKDAVDRQRLLRRYLNEARARRRKAFAAWLEAVHAERGSRLGPV